MRLLAAVGDAHHHRAERLKLCHGVAESVRLLGAARRAVVGVEEEHHLLAEDWRLQRLEAHRGAVLVLEREVGRRVAHLPSICGKTRAKCRQRRQQRARRADASGKAPSVSDRAHEYVCPFVCLRVPFVCPFGWAGCASSRVFSVQRSHVAAPPPHSSPSELRQQRRPAGAGRAPPPLKRLPSLSLMFGGGFGPQPQPQP